MKAKIVLSNSGGELSSVVIDVNDETDPNISQAVADIATNGIQIGDTITVTETQEAADSNPWKFENEDYKDSDKNPPYPRDYAPGSGEYNDMMFGESPDY